MDNRKIGVFDSGIGGLTVVRALFDVLPQERLVYVGDTRNVPYGDRDQADITRLSLRIIEFLKEQNVKAIVAACNTMCAVCIDEMRAAAGIPVVDIIPLGARAAAREAKKGVCILATQSAIASGAHEQIIHEENPGLALYSRACPTLVPIVEAGQQDSDIARAAVRRYLAGIDEQKADCLLLGCTHYPLLDGVLREVTGMTLIDPAVHAALALKDLLETNNATAGGTAGEHTFFASGDTQAFDGHLRRVLHIHSQTRACLHH